MLKEISKEEISQANLSKSIKLLLCKQRKELVTEKQKKKKLLFLTDFDDFLRHAARQKYLS